MRLAPEPTQPRPPPETDAPFPSDTASDVVSYSDHVALVTAVTEADAPAATPTTTANGDSVVMRDITFHVDDVFWSRPDAPPAPARFSARWWGWVVRDGKRSPFIVDGAPVVFVGAQYVVPIAYDATAFTVIQPFAAFRFSNHAIALEEQDTALARELRDASQRRVTEVFIAAAPDPLALRYRRLPPRTRLAAVLQRYSSLTACFVSHPVRSLRWAGHANASGYSSSSSLSAHVGANRLRLCTSPTTSVTNSERDKVAEREGRPLRGGEFSTSKNRTAPRDSPSDS